jgi:hypothetical protein
MGAAMPLLGLCPTLDVPRCAKALTYHDTMINPDVGGDAAADERGVQAARFVAISNMATRLRTGKLLPGEDPAHIEDLVRRYITSDEEQVRRFVTPEPTAEDP